MSATVDPATAAARNKIRRIYRLLRAAESDAKTHTISALTEAHNEAGDSLAQSVANLLSRHVTEMGDAIAQCKREAAKVQSSVAAPPGAASATTSPARKLREVYGHKKRVTMRNLWIHSSISDPVASVLTRRVKDLFSRNTKVVRNVVDLYPPAEEGASKRNIYQSTLLVVTSDPEWGTILREDAAQQLIACGGAIVSAQLLNALLVEMAAGAAAHKVLRDAGRASSTRAPVKSFFDDMIFYPSKRDTDEPLRTQQTAEEAFVQRYHLDKFGQVMQQTLNEIQTHTFMAAERAQAERMKRKQEKRKRKRDESDSKERASGSQEQSGGTTSSQSSQSD